MARNIFLISIAALLVTFLPVPGAHASAISCAAIGSDGFELCYTFDGKKGEFPEAGLTPDAKGNLYTVTFGALGGSDLPGKHCSKSSCGTADGLFGGDDDLRLLHHFAAGQDGAFPAGEVVVQNHHAIFGTTEYGPGTACGGLGCGSVFSLMKNVGAPGYTETAIPFCHLPNCLDGAFPRAGLIADGKDSSANLYGTTVVGGAGQGELCGSNLGGCGIVYEMVPGNPRPQVIYSFCTSVVNNLCMDGAVPYGRLLRDETTGVLYGTTEFGGSNGYGTVFALTPQNSGSWTESVLYSFTGGSDGGIPEAGIVADSLGNIYGTTTFGGIACDGNSGCGVVFKLAPNGDGTWNETVLHTFTGLQGGNTPDGDLPQNQLTIDQAGNLFGTTLRGGEIAGGHRCVLGFIIGCGTIFTLTGAAPEGYAILHVFGVAKGTPDQINPDDGTHPEGALLLQEQDGVEYLYGSAREGGDPVCRCGTLYRLDLTAAKRRLPRRSARAATHS